MYLYNNNYIKNYNEVNERARCRYTRHLIVVSVLHVARVMRRERRGPLQLAHSHRQLQAYAIEVRTTSNLMLLRN